MPEKLIIKRLETDIGRYDRILFFPEEELLSEFCFSSLAKEKRKKILVLSLKNIVECPKNICFRKIAKIEAERIIQFYFTYEFSDKFIFVSRNNCNYGSLFHFVDTGILSMEEAVKAFIT